MTESSGSDTSGGVLYAGRVETLVAAGRIAVADDPDLTVWRMPDGTLAASDDRCPHYFASLRVVGEIHGDRLRCAAHGAEFELCGGRPVRGPTRSPLRVYDVVLTPRGDVYVVRPGPVL